MRVMLRDTFFGQIGPPIPVSQRRFRIGRAADNDLVLYQPWVSRFHCQLHIAEGRVTIEDLGSRNGTYVNGDRILGERVLHPGDFLTVGVDSYEVLVEHDVRMPCGADEGLHSIHSATAC